MIFWIIGKRPRWVNQSTLGRPRYVFGPKKLDFWCPFWPRFFNLFENGANAPDTMFSNSFGGLKPSKSFDFDTGFSSVVHVFPNQLQEAIFGGYKRPFILQAAFSDQFLILQGSNKSNLETTFSAERPGKLLTPFTGASATFHPWHRKGPRYFCPWCFDRNWLQIWRIFSRFLIQMLVGLGQIWNSLILYTF